MEVHRNDNVIHIHQHKFVHDFLLEDGLQDAKPLSLHVDYSWSDEDGNLFSDTTLYREFIGNMLYLTMSRPELTYIVNYLSQFLHFARVPHLIDVQRVLRYL